MSTATGLPLALTMGDPAGIGPEITVKAWESLRNRPELAFFVIGDPCLYENGFEIDRPDKAKDVFGDALPIIPVKCGNVRKGKPDIGANEAVLESIA